MASVSVMERALFLVFYLLGLNLSGCALNCSLQSWPSLDVLLFLTMTYMCNGACSSSYVLFAW
jgi:hypothetical protein